MEIWLGSKGASCEEEEKERPTSVLGSLAAEFCIGAVSTWILRLCGSRKKYDIDSGTSAVNAAVNILLWIVLGHLFRARRALAAPGNVSGSHACGIMETDLCCDYLRTLVFCIVKSQERWKEIIMFCNWISGQRTENKPEKRLNEIHRAQGLCYSSHLTGTM